MLVAMNRTGNVRIITDYVPVCGEKLIFASNVCGQKLIFVSNNKFAFNMDANKGVIFSPGNGHTVGYWNHINGELHIGFYENSGDLRQLVNNIFPYLYHFNIKTKRVTEIKYRIKGRNELKKFAEIMSFDIMEKRREGIVVIEGVYADKVVCLIEYDGSEEKIETIDLCGVSAETVNDVFKFFGNCKYTGNVRSTAITDGVKTEFGNFDILETFENFVYKVTDFGEHRKSLMTTDMLNNYLRVLNRAHKSYKVAVERYNVRVSPYGKKYLVSGNKQTYTVKKYIVKG